ncbi:MAG TPA: carbohydrate ABC transporter permease [Acidimicrobiales bacterium]|nr:carbohydrate ABC transporter permease [Acidimicrobiales bacterium]
MSSAKTAGRQPERLLPGPLRWAVLVLAAFLVFVPVAYLLVLSVTPDAQVSLGNIWPSHLEISNYWTIWSTVSLGRGFLNSAVICGGAALAAVLVASLAAYPLARFEFFGRRSFLYSVLGAQIVPGSMVLLPLFVTFSAIQAFIGVVVIGSYWAMIVTYLTFSLPFAVWMMVSYLRTVPRELEEAAMVDGAGPLRALARVVLPLTVPGMVVTFVFSFLLGWNDVLFASVLTSPSTRTLAVDLQVFSFVQDGAGVPQYASLMAAGVEAAVPVVVIYLVLQRYVVGGLSAGAVK